MRIFLLPILLSLLLGGCSVFEKADQAQRAVDADITEVEILRSQMRDLMAAHAVKASAQAPKPKTAPALPARFRQELSQTATQEALDDVLVNLSRQSGLPIWLTEFAQDPRSSGGNLGDQLVSFQYQGTLQGLLDHLAQITKLHWRYTQNRVEFFLYETRHFHVNLPMGARSVSANIASTSGKSSPANSAGTSVASDDGSGESTGQIRVNTGGISIDPYDALKRTITAMLVQDGGLPHVEAQKAETLLDDPRVADFEDDPDNDVEPGAGIIGSVSGRRIDRPRAPAKPALVSQVVVTPEMAMVTVTAPPSSLDRIAEYVEEVNQRFTRNVMIDVKIYDVTINDTTGAGFSVDLLYRKLGDYGIQFSNGGMGVLGGSDAPTGIMSRFTGSQAIVRALSSFGRISAITSGQVIAVNGQPAPLQIGSEITYLAGTETLDRGTSVTGTRLDTHLVTRQISVGLTANFLPQVLKDDRILLQYQLTSRALAGMATITGSDGNSIQLPTVTSQTLQQQAFVKDGESIVLFGIEQNQSGVSGSHGIPLTYNRDVSNERTLRVIVMQVFGAGVQGEG